MTSPQSAPVSLPRVAITFCTQCRWMLRAAYFGQELLSTFGTQIGEVALIPATGGLFTVELMYVPPALPNEEQNVEIKKILLWDRKAEGGFPETKVLKQRVRDHIDPSRDLGHSDKHGKKKEEKPEEKKVDQEQEQEQKSELRSVPEQEEKSEEKNVVQEQESVVEQGEQDEGVQLKRNPDGTVCEDCR